MSADAQASQLHVRLAMRILRCDEMGVRLLRLRVTPQEWRVLQQDYVATSGVLLQSAVPPSFMGYPVVVNWPPLDPYAANRRMERMSQNWYDRPRNVRGAPV